MSKMNLPYESECKLECLKCGARFCDWMEFPKRGAIGVTLCPKCNCISESYIHEVLK